MRNILIPLVAILFIAFSCSKKTTTIVPINEAASLSPKGMVYALPKTNLRVKVESQLTVVIPGPYSQFALKYLGITNVPVVPLNQWAISGIEVFSSFQPDMQALFVIEPIKDFNIDFLSLTNNGLIIPVGSAFFQSHEQSVKPLPLTVGQEGFHDLSYSPFIASERTTHYTRSFQDSAFVRVPVHKTIVVEKSLEDKAREAADFIFSLRKRRLELLSGDADFVAEGKAVETVLKEINRLEEEYLTLFVGKRFANSTFHWFDFAPTSKEEASTILFRFSPSRGVLPSSDLSGSPVLISATIKTDWHNLDIINQLSIEKGAQRTDAVYYRLPVPSVVKINDSQSEFFSQELTFYQFGPLVRMPARFLITNQGRVIFPKSK